MLVSMQGNWTVDVLFKSASFAQRVTIRGASSGNGEYEGIPGTSVSVTGTQWSIAVLNDPGTGFELSKTRISTPQKIGNKYVFTILSNDAGGDEDYNDLILRCSTPATVFDYIVHGNVSLYSGRCIINPCWKFPFVIETPEALREAIKNKNLYEIIQRDYPERIANLERQPDLPDTIFKPIVLDPTGELTAPKTRNYYAHQLENELLAATQDKDKAATETPLSLADYQLVNTKVIRKATGVITASASAETLRDLSDLTLINPCSSEPAQALTLSFEEYDPTANELAGGPYTGNGRREILGDTIVDEQGNYIFRFRRYPIFWRQELSVVEKVTIDPTELTTAEQLRLPSKFSADQPDIIVKVASPTQVYYETAPYYDIPNLKRIDICIPKSRVEDTAYCFNGNLLGSLGNVFLGGNQNTAASTAPAALARSGYGNELTAAGIITVNNSSAGFQVNCAAWRGTIDLKGCMYDTQKTPVQNKIHWFTIRIRRAGTSTWEFVQESYLHPRFSNRHLPNYIGDKVGSFTKKLNVDGAGKIACPAYKNIQREAFAEGIDWEFSNISRYMRLNTRLYDTVGGQRTPGTYHVRVDGYDELGNPVAGATDMIALFIHNIPLNGDIDYDNIDNFSLGSLTLTGDGIITGECGLYQLPNNALKAPLSFSYIANDPYGFLYDYELNLARCPGRNLKLKQANGTTITLSSSGNGTLDEGQTNQCGYRGTSNEHVTSGTVGVVLTPTDGWISATEYFTRLNFSLTASMRVTNGFNSGRSGTYRASQQILMEKKNP